METELAQEIKEQGLRNLMLIAQGRAEETLGDDFDFERLYPVDPTRKGVDIEDVSLSYLGDRPVEMMAFWREEAKTPDDELSVDDAGTFFVNIESHRRGNVDNRYLKIYKAADERYIQAKKSLILSLWHDCNTLWECDQEYFRFVSVCKALRKATGLNDAYPFLPWDLQHEMELVRRGIEAEMFLRERRKADRDARFARLEKIEKEKEKRAVYLASHKEVVFKFKEAVSA